MHKLSININRNPYVKSDSDQKLLSELFSLVDATRSSYFCKLRWPAYKHIASWMHEKLKDTLLKSFPEAKLSTQCVWLFNGFVDYPACPVCGGPMFFKKDVSLKGYLGHCSDRCKTKDPSVQRKIKDTCIDKYGVDWTSKSQESKDNCRKTCLKKYGYENPYQVPRFIEKSADTRLARYGDRTYRNNTKRIETCRLKYGSGTNGKKISESRLSFSDEKWADIDNKSRNTKSAKYGNPTYNNSEKAAKTRQPNITIIVNKCKTTCHEHHGYDCIFQKPEFIENNKKRPRSHAKSKYEYKLISFDSAPELALFIWCEDHGIDFKFHPDLAFEYTYEGKTHVYHPDFIINGELIEIKGDHFFKDSDPSKELVNPFNHMHDGEAEAKWRCAKSHNVRFLSSKDYIPYIKYVKETYGGKYLQSFKIKRK